MQYYFKCDPIHLNNSLTICNNLF